MPNFHDKDNVIIPFKNFYFAITTHVITHNIHRFHLHQKYSICIENIK